MTKFKTPVAMKVTEEQGKYLGEELTKLGYFEAVRENSGYICTNWNGIHCQFAISNYEPLHRLIIEEYNPELFLAIAAMTEGDIPIEGEWIYFDQLPKIFQWGTGQISLDNPTGSGHFHKPTIQQLKEHFKNSNKEEKSWYVMITDKMRKEFHQEHLEYVYESTFKQEVPEEFYVRYCEEFTEEFYEALKEWAKQNSTGPEYGFFKTYHELIEASPLTTAKFNFSKAPHKDISYAYGLDNNTQDIFKTEYTIEQVKKLINYKPKINNNEYKENNCKKESRESEQVNEDLGRNSSSERGKEVKARVKCSRNFCERGSISSSEKITRTRRTSSRIRAEKGGFNF